jgi:hypothetical protein
MPPEKSRVMTVFRSLFLAAAIATGLTSAPALADPPRDSQRAFEATREGRSMPLPQLERRVLPFMGGADYLGPELNGGTYRLKFIQNGRVIWVDVDAQSGRILRRSRPK